MTRRHAAALAFLIIAGACEKHDNKQQPALQPKQANAPEPEMPSPVLLRYKPAQEGGPGAFMAAIVRGVLDFSGPCVRLQHSSGQFRTVVSTAGSRLERDFAGLYWQVGNRRLRHGSSVIGGGGEMPQLPTDQVLDGPVPQACRTGPALELIGPQRYDPPDEPPPRPAG